MKSTGKRIKKLWRAFKAEGGTSSLKTWAREAPEVDGLGVEAWLDRKAAQ